MINYKAIADKVHKLEIDALTIESEIIQFFSLVEIPPSTNSNNSENIFSLNLSPKKDELWYIPIDELAESHRSLIKHYETWYNQSHILIQNYYVNKEIEFVELHDGKKEMCQYVDVWNSNKILTNNVPVFYGISQLLQFDEKIRHQYDPHSLVQEVIGQFLKQRSIILSLPEVLPYISLKEKENLNESSHNTESKASISASHSIINVGSDTAVQSVNSTNTIINVHNFNQVSEIIISHVRDENKKQDLLSQVKKLELNQGKHEYTELYQNFIASLADHMTVLLPIITFLSQYLPK